MLPRGLRRTDRRASDAAYTWPSPRGLDEALRSLSSAAEKGSFWFALAGLLGLTGRAGRVAAARGLLSLGVASGLANLLAKRVLREHRPHGHGFRHHRRPGTVPSSASLPSGHSTSAAAFTAGVWLEDPRRGAAVAPLGAAVAYSRLHLGQHWFVDIASGALAGVTLAAILRRLVRAPRR